MSYTLATLITEIENLQEDSFDDFTRDIPGIIKRAETRLYLDMGLELSDKVATISVLDYINGIFRITDDHQSMSTLAIVDPATNGKKYLSLRSSSYLRMANENRSVDGKPEFYGPAPWGSCADDPEPNKPSYMLAPLTDKGLTHQIQAIIHVVPETLVEKTEGTWISTNQPDLLLAGALVEVERRNKNPEAQAGREAEYQRLVMEWSGMTNPQRKRDGHNAQQGIGQ